MNYFCNVPETLKDIEMKSNKFFLIFSYLHDSRNALRDIRAKLIIEIT